MKYQRTTNCQLKLDVLHGFGSLCSQGLRDSVSIIDDEQRKILFPIGKYFALKSYDKTEEQFIKMPENTCKLVSMCVSPNRKCLAASVSIKGDNYPQILIYNIKNYLQKGEREKIFRYTDTKSDRFIAMAFSGGDARFLVCMTGEPDYQIIFLDIARMKPLGYAMLGHPVNKLSINPKENHVITVSGQNMFKILRVQENSFKQLNEISQLPTNQNFTDHCWLDESYLIIGNDKGTVYIIENYEVQEIFENSFNQNNIGVSALTCFNRGFIIGSDKGHFALYMKIDEYNDGVEDYKFMLKRTFMADRVSGICHINISNKSDIVAVSFKSNDIATFELNFLMNSNNEKFSSKKNQVKFEYLFNGFHSNSVTSMDICLQRPLIVTCSKYDSSIRIWNYYNFKCELAKKFYLGDESTQQEINLNPLNCVAFHPFGYYIAAGFLDKIRFYHVLHDCFRQYKDIQLRNCIQIKFSNGGHYIACAYTKNKSNNCMINVYNSYTIEKLITLKGHQNYVNELIWDHNDQNLYSVGQDGNIYMYCSSKNWQRRDFMLSQNNVSSRQYQSMVFAERGVNVVCGMENQKSIVREIEKEEFQIISAESNSSKDMNPLKVQSDQEKMKNKVFQLNQTNLTSLTYLVSLKQHQAIIGGDDQGQIKVYSSIFKQQAFETLASHDGAVTKLKTSPDGRYVFSAGEDGAIFIYQVTEMTSDGALVGLQSGDHNAEDNNLNSCALIVDEQLADVVLVDRKDIDTYLNVQRQLRNDIEDLENKIEQKHYDERNKLAQAKKDAEEQMQKQIEFFDLRYEELKSQKQEVEKDYNNLLKNMENNHLKAVEELENLYEKKLAFENEKYIQLESTQTEERLKQKKQIEDFKDQNRKTLEILKSEFQNKFNDVEGLYKVTKDNAKRLGNMFSEKLNQQEDEYEQEIDIINKKQKKGVDSLKMEITNTKTKTEALVNENKNIHEELEIVNKNKSNLENQIEKLNQTIQEQEDRIKILLKEQKEQEETLKKKDKKIYEYKYKISDLQKAKHVLSFRTAEMRKSLEPKEAQIEKLKEELFKLEQEFENMLKTSQKSNDDFKKLKNKCETLQNNYNKQVEETKKHQNKLNKIIMSIHNCVKSRDIKEWNSVMKGLYYDYVKDHEVNTVKADPKGVEEMQRQMSHLENCVDQIHLSSTNIIKRRELDIRKKTMENAVLIYDLNQIRRVNKEQSTNITKLDTQIQHYKNENEYMKIENRNLKKQLEKYQSELIYQQNINQPNNYPIQNNDNVQSGFTLNKKQTQKNLQQQQTPQIGGIQRMDTEKKMNKLLNQQFVKKVSAKRSMGKLYTGANFDKNTLNAFDKAKMMDTLIDLENGAQRILAQEGEIKKLKQKIKNHIIDKGCEMSLDDFDDNSEYIQDSQLQME